MLIPRPYFSLTFQSHPYIISNLKDFEALPAESRSRNYVTGFLIVYSRNTHICYSSLAVFHYHFIYSLLIFGSPNLSSAALLFIRQQFLFFHISIIGWHIIGPKSDVSFPFFLSFNIKQVLPLTIHPGVSLKITSV